MNTQPPKSRKNDGEKNMSQMEAVEALHFDSNFDNRINMETSKNTNLFSFQFLLSSKTSKRTHPWSFQFPQVPGENSHPKKARCWRHSAWQVLKQMELSKSEVPF